MSPKATVLALFLAFLVPSALLVALQQDCTNRAEPDKSILPGYFAGTGPVEVVGSAAAVRIVEARCLMRGLLYVCECLYGEGLTAYNRVIQFFSVWGALCLIYLTAARLMMPPVRALAAVLVAVVFVPWGFLSVSNQTSWPYDLPSLFFASLGLWAIVSRRFVLFAVTLVLGTLNKETVVFLLPAYVLAEWPLLPRKTLVARALGLAGLFLVTYEVPRMILACNHAPVVTVSAMDLDTPRWQQNLWHLVLVGHGTVLENVYLALSVHLLPVLRLSTLPWPLRAAYFAVPVLLLPIFFCGNIYELRLYNEIIPLGAVGTVFAFSRLFETFAAPDPTAS